MQTNTLSRMTANGSVKEGAMVNKFRIVARRDKWNGEAVLFLPDLGANPGNIACYACFGEHSEAQRLYYLEDTLPPDENALDLAHWYGETRCKPDENPVVQKRLKVSA